MYSGIPIQSMISSITKNIKEDADLLPVRRITTIAATAQRLPASKETMAPI
jgi:hypothetical protein